MPNLATLLAQSTALHGHLCPRQVLGVRMGMYAAELLDLPLPQTDKRLFCFVETDGCFSDGVMVATGCSLGHRTMRLIDYGKVAATFVDTETERGVRIAPHPLARRRAQAYAATIESHWQAQLEAYQIMPLDALFEAEPICLNLSLKALISQPGLRVTCSVCGEEILNQREINLAGRVVCQSCAGESYWSALEETAPTGIAAHSTSFSP